MQRLGRAALVRCEPSNQLSSPFIKHEARRLVLDTQLWLVETEDESSFQSPNVLRRRLEQSHHLFVRQFVHGSTSVIRRSVQLQEGVSACASRTASRSSRRASASSLTTSGAGGARRFEHAMVLFRRSSVSFSFMTSPAVVGRAFASCLVHVVLRWTRASASDCVPIPRRFSHTVRRNAWWGCSSSLWLDAMVLRSACIARSSHSAASFFGDAASRRSCWYCLARFSFSWYSTNMPCISSAPRLLMTFTTVC